MVISEINIINFGSISNKKIQFTDGFNVLTGNNEAGKSTVLSFVRFVLYGFPSKKKEDLKKYEPLSGEKINGSVTVKAGNTTYEISRNLNLAKSKQVSVVNKTTGEVMDKSFCDDVGFNLFKMGDASFVNTLFIGQNSGKISADKDELLTKLSNLCESGDEDVSYGEISSKIENSIASFTSQRRKDAVIVNLEREINELNSALSEANKKKEENDEKKKEIAFIKEKINEKEKEKENLSKSYEISRILVSKKKLNEEQNEISRAKACIATDTKLYEAIEPDTIFANIDNEQEALYINELSFEEKLESYKKEHKKYMLSSGICLIIGIILFMALIFAKPLFSIGSVVPITISGVLFALGRSALKKKHEILKEKEVYKDGRNAYFTRFGASGKDDYLKKKKEYADMVHNKAVLEEKIRLQKENLDLLERMYEKTKSETLTNYENIDTIKISDYDSAKNPDEINDGIKVCEKELSTLLERLHFLEFETSQKSGEDVISILEKLDNKNKELKEAKEELEILELFKKYLDSSFDELKSNFAPALALESSKIFKTLTGEKYDDILVNDAFDAKIKIGSSYEDSIHLSGATLDQLYFAVRLGIINTVKLSGEQYPVILDDAFAFYDDKRLKKVLDFLKEYSKNAQVIVSSCHKREADYLKNEANIIEL